MKRHVSVAPCENNSRTVHSLNDAKSSAPMKCLLKVFNCLALFCLASAAAQAGTITWDGGGDGTSWTNRFNWSGDTLPGSADDVVIDVTGDLTVTLSGANATVRSLQCAEGLTVSGRTLTVTGGGSQISGAFTMQGGASLAASGAGTAFTAAGPTTANDSGFTASGGAGWGRRRCRITARGPSPPRGR